MFSNFTMTWGWTHRSTSTEQTCSEKFLQNIFFFKASLATVALLHQLHKLGRDWSEPAFPRDAKKVLLCLLCSTSRCSAAECHHLFLLCGEKSFSAGTFTRNMVTRQASSRTRLSNKLHVSPLVEMTDSHIRTKCTNGGTHLYLSWS